MSEVLFRLIKSMSTSEKVYFKRMSKIHDARKNKNYLKVYEVFENMESYNKGDLMLFFKGTTIAKYLSSEVKYLKEKILTSLFNFNLNRTKNNQIARDILYIEVLINKNLKKEALKIVKSSMKKAKRVEAFSWILRLIELQEKVLFEEGIIGYKGQLEELKVKRQTVTDSIQNLNTFRLLRAELRELQFNDRFIVDDFRCHPHLYKNYNVLNRESCLSDKALEHWYYIQVLVNHLTRNFEKSLKYSVEHVNFILRNMHLFSIHKLLPALSNYIYHAALTKNKTHFDLGIQKLIVLRRDDFVSKNYIDYIQFTRTLEYAYYQKDQIMTRRYIKSVCEMLDSQKLMMAQMQYVFMIVVRGFVFLEQFEEAMGYLFRWRNQGVLDYVQVRFSIFAVIIYGAMCSTSLLNKELAVLSRVKRKAVREMRLIDTILRFYKSKLKANLPYEGLVRELQINLKEIKDDQTSNFDFVSFDYYQWSLSLTNKQE